MPGMDRNDAVGSSPPLAGGLPLSEAIADQAAEWLTLLMSGEATDNDRARLARWRAEHADHERAWQHIERVAQGLKAMAPHPAYKALSPYASTKDPQGSTRRKAMRALLWVGVAGGSGLLASRTPAWQQMTADHRTSTGEQRTLTLADDTTLMLNTASAIDVRFDGRQRLVRLVAGEVLIRTGHASADARPFIVETKQGRIRALGTRFTVRQRRDDTQVVVLDDAVAITPRDAEVLQRVLQAGEQATFTHASIDPPQAVGEEAAAWARGQLVADEMRLGDFLAELGRYRPGLLRCAPEVAGLRFSGVFPLQDTDRILSTLPSVLPVRVTMRTRYWATVDTAR